VHNGVSISESALVLGAWKFQQGKFCNCGKSGLGFGGGFSVSVLAKEGLFQQAIQVAAADLQAEEDFWNFAEV
jgi:hypothetical protein